MIGTKDSDTTLRRIKNVQCIARRKEGGHRTVFSWGFTPLSAQCASVRTGRAKYLEIRKAHRIRYKDSATRITSDIARFGQDTFAISGS